MAGGSQHGTGGIVCFWRCCCCCCCPAIDHHLADRPLLTDGHEGGATRPPPTTHRGPEENGTKKNEMNDYENKQEKGTRSGQIRTTRFIIFEIILKVFKTIESL